MLYLPSIGAVLLISAGLASRISSTEKAQAGTQQTFGALEGMALDALSEMEEEMFAMSQGALKPICEDMGLELPLELQDELDRPLTEEETDESFKKAGLVEGSTNASLRPTATWVVGPSASGKSFVTNSLLAEISAPVVLDGDAFRDSHRGYQATVWNGFNMQETPCIWKAAWEIVKPHRFGWRQELWDAALKNRQNLIIVDVCTGLQSCIDKMNDLKELGYTNNVMAVTIKESISVARGTERASVVGKRFGPTFRLSMLALPGIIEAANGWYKVLDNSFKVEASAAQRCEIFGQCPKKILAEGKCFNSKHYPAWAAPSQGNHMMLTERAVESFVAGIEQYDSGAHLPSCESIGVAVSDEGAAAISRPLTEDELRQFTSMSQVDIATPQEKPLALWILGAAAVGKSTAVAASSLPKEMGLKYIDETTGAWDAVILDGEFYRQIHAGFQQVIDEGRFHDPPCVFQGGWDASLTAKESKAEKKRIFAEAVEAKKNLIIPSSCAGGFDECLRKVQVLKDAGYTNHIVAVTAKGSIIDSRGLSRADFQGKAYTSLLKESLDAFLPMITIINGRWELLDNTGSFSSVGRGLGADKSHACAVALRKANPFLKPSAKINELCSTSADDMIETQALIVRHQQKIESYSSVTDHLPMCEDIGFNLPDYLRAEMMRKTTKEEIQAAERRSGRDTATQKEAPVAVWILGSSAVGKSTLAKETLDELGIQQVNNSAGKLQHDAVKIDWKLFRSTHVGFKSVVKHGLQQAPPCIYRDGWKGTQAAASANDFENRMFIEAVKGKRNLLIQTSCSSISICIKKVTSLKHYGYTNHIVAAYAREKLVEERGKSRADREGKPFEPKVDDAVFAFAPMMAVANGRCTLVDTTAKAKAKVMNCLDLKVDNTKSLSFEQRMNKIIRPQFDLGPSLSAVESAPSKFD
eukprot:TRINITY_DN6562_c0_g1_i1.p1 TRINITY_DN6562_c0_g1~~TRINITY_DN6562_c0_g1_i1.p1  ORF type:complete len:926 (-),score=137.59 TRINITY_DN6562_c0_g1_i1:79-2856(-)